MRYIGRLTVTHRYVRARARCREPRCIKIAMGRNQERRCTSCASPTRLNESLDHVIVWNNKHSRKNHPRITSAKRSTDSHAFSPDRPGGRNQLTPREARRKRDEELEGTGSFVKRRPGLGMAPTVSVSRAIFTQLRVACSTDSVTPKHEGDRNFPRNFAKTPRRGLFQLSGLSYLFSSPVYQ